ncbi:MAG: hypothetical protein ACKOXB_02330 [Flavobacteriales bacterium]
MQKLLLLLLFVSTQSFATKYIHVVVALCDNKNQGIVPVPEKIGNGQDPANNLYWGCGYGVKTFFKKQTDWKCIKTYKNPSVKILERLVFKHRDSAIYMIADAYDGKEIKQSTLDFFAFASGKNKFDIKVDSLTTVKAGGNADLVCYVGHDGLMDFTIDTQFPPADKKVRQTIALACYSKNFFAQHLKATGAQPLVWSTHLMSPEAYTLDASIDSWILKEAAAVTREKAAQAYNQYQKCGIKGARNLLITGW